MLQITRSGETQAIKNTGETELVFLGALIATLDVLGLRWHWVTLKPLCSNCCSSRPLRLNEQPRQVRIPQQGSQNIQEFGIHR